MKQCLRCKEEKPLEEFGKTFRNKKKSKFNLRSYCIVCDRINNKEYREKNANILIEKRKNRIKNLREKTGVAVHHGFAIVDENETKKRESCRHKAINLRKKRIIKDPGYCQFCGIDKIKLEMHHAKYDFPESVIFLCRSCHLKMHWKVLNER